MIGATVGQVSAMINGAIVLVQVTLPLLVVLVLVGLLRVRETAATWTVAARSIQASFWPSILHLDSSLNRGVQRQALTLSWISAVGYILLIVVGVVTPLGLSDQLQLAKERVVSFNYVADKTTMGLGTPRRDQYEYTRQCGSYVPAECPGVDAGFDTVNYGWYEANSTFNKSIHIYDMEIPRNTTDVFTSATANTTVSSLFDIQFRTYQRRTDKLFKNNVIPLRNNSLYIVRSSTYLHSILLNNKIELVEGLVVDSIHPGIGFRNHTIPPQTEHGSSWEEDLLWIEPVTQCVDTNLTFEFNKIGNYDVFGLEEAFLVDNGGIANLTKEYPFVDRNDTQKDPQLRAIAYKVAVLNNKLTANYFNLTEKKGAKHDPALGAKYNLTDPLFVGYRYKPEPQKIVTSGLNGYHLPQTILPDIEDWQAADVASRGYGALDTVNISTVGIEVGVIMGVPFTTDGSYSLVREYETHWTQNFVACASATRASIKTIKLSTKGTNLEDVTVSGISDKAYTDESTLPVWAIENSNLFVKDYSPIWGLVDPKYEDAESLQTIRKQHLWLLAGRKHPLGDYMPIFDSLPADAHMLALSAAYQVGLSPLDSRDYSGRNDFALSSRWSELSRSPETMGKIIDLIWTDHMANLVLGTKPGPFSSEKAVSGPSFDRVIRLWEKRVVFDSRFAIPAIFLLALWSGCLFGALVLIFLSKISLSGLAQLTNQLSPGRIATNFLASDICRSDASTKEWAREAGRLVIGFERIENPTTTKEAEDVNGLCAIAQKPWAEKDHLIMVKGKNSNNPASVSDTMAKARKRIIPADPAPQELSPLLHAGGRV